MAFHPHFLFGAPKRKRRWNRQKKKRLSLRSYGREAPCRTTGCGSKRSCSVDAAPAGARAGLSADLRTVYAVLHSEVIGQRPNLTSDSFRAQSVPPALAAAIPLVGYFLLLFSPIPRPRRRKRSAVRQLPRALAAAPQPPVGADDPAARTPVPRRAPPPQSPAPELPGFPQPRPPQGKIP